jgi:hypothetical protein
MHAQMMRVLVGLSATAYDDQAPAEGCGTAPPTPWTHQLRVLLRRSWLDTRCVNSERKVKLPI